MDETQQLISNIISVWEPLTWLINSYVSDYFVCNHWKKVNPAWWSLLSELEPEELASLLNINTWNSKSVWPLSLLAYRTTIHVLSLDRQLKRVSVDAFVSDTAEKLEHEKSIQESDLEQCFRRHIKPKKQHEIKQLSETINKLCENCRCRQVLDIGAGQGHLSRILAFRYGLQATTIEAVGCHNPKAQKLDNQVKFDIENGRIYSRKVKQEQKITDKVKLLSANSPHHVTATIEPDISAHSFLEEIKKYIEGNDNHTSSRTNCENTLNKDFNNLHEITPVSSDCKCGNSKETCENLKETHQDTNVICESSNKMSRNHVEARDTKQFNNLDINSDESKTGNEQYYTGCKDNIQSKSTTPVKEYEDTSQFIITGLHACGDLTATMLRMFVQCSQICGLASVGCCYMKLSTGIGDECVPGYPMSKYVKTLPNSHLNYEALEMACHFVDAYHLRLLGDGVKLRSHCYRAALQEIIAEKDPTFHHGCTKITIKNTTDLNFKQYAEKALKKLHLDIDLTDAQLHRAEQRLRKWKEVVAFYTLRLSLAPLLETLILLDRVLYLQEHEIDCRLVPIFDPLVSPRNFVLLAQKHIKPHTL